MVQNVQSALGLDRCFGYITLANPHETPLLSQRQKGEEGEETEENGEPAVQQLVEQQLQQEQHTFKATNGGDGWVPMAVYFGMPLFNTELNKEVCNSIEARHLLCEENVSQYTRYSQCLANKLLDFIETHQAANYKYEVIPGQIPYPTQILTFEGHGQVKRQ